jgi:hypothetical protein
MSNEDSPARTAIETHEEFIQHIEAGRSKILVLSLMTIFVSGLLALSYVYQLLLPYVSSTTTVTVNLLDPSLMVFEAVLIILALLWLYVGIRDYVFTLKLSRGIAQARTLEAELQKRIEQ